MELSEIISELVPINTKEKVDVLVQRIKENQMKINSKSDISIRCAIQKMSIQQYYIEHYKYLVVKEETPKEEAKRLKDAKRERERIDEERRGAKEQKKQAKAEKKKGKKKKKSKAFLFCHDSASIIRTFSSENKAAAETIRMHNEMHSKTYPTSSVKSIRAISIPAGGMNKR